MRLPLVSIIIATKNEERNIENCLKSILQQSYPHDKIEIIVVDNNSTDRTKEIARKYTDKVCNKGPERSAQRNFGAKQSKGEYYLYLDADMILSPDVISECVQKFKDSQVQNLAPSNFKTLKLPNLVALYIPEIVMGDSFWAKVRRFERSFYNATVIDAVRIIRLKDFLAVGGFDENMIAAEDWDLNKRLKNIGNFGIVNSPLYHNEENFNIFNYLNKKSFYSKDIKEYIAKWDKNDLEIKKQFGFYYRFIGVFVENRKWKELIRHPILTFGMYFLRFLVGLNFLIIK